MADCCEYRVKVKGRKNACYAFFGSMSCMDYKDMNKKSGRGSNFELIFSGNCKWDVDHYCYDKWDGSFPVEIPADPDEALEEAENKYWYHTVQERSKMFAVEVWCLSYEDEDIFEDEDEEEDKAKDKNTLPIFVNYQHYKNGEQMRDEEPPSDLLSHLPIKGNYELL